MNYTYIQAIGMAFPNVQCHAQGVGDTYESLEYDAGDPIPSKEVLDAWIAENPKPQQVQVGFLADGTPAYYYAQADCNISIEKATVTFSTRTNGAKNFYLDLQNADSSTNGFPVKRKALVKSISISLKATVTDSVTVQVKGSTGTVLATATLAANTKSTSVELGNTIASGETLSCYLLSNKVVANPVVVCELAWRD